MKGSTPNRPAILLYVMALVIACNAAMAASDAAQFSRFLDPNQWGAPAGNWDLTRYSPLNGINTGNITELQMAWSQSSGTLRNLSSIPQGSTLYTFRIGGG